MVKAVYIGRHVLLPAQEVAVRACGLEIAEKIENLPTDSRELQKLVNELKQKGIAAVVTIALPPNLLAVLGSAFDLYVFEMQSTTVASIDEAMNFVRSDPSKRTYLPGKPNESIRVLEFKGINKLKIIIESKPVYTVP